MQRMTTTRDQEVYIDLSLVTSLSPETSKICDGYPNYTKKDIQVTFLYTSGGQLHIIKEPSFLKILGLTEATKEISSGVPLGSIPS